jgi:rare lipoprotein A
MAAAAAMLLASCSISRPGGYDGYMTRSYTVRGQTYHPMSVDEALGHEETGTCSWYNESRFFGLKRGNTSLGEKVMPWHLTGAHKTLPLPALVRVTNLENGRSVKLRINDRGPFIPGRHLDVTPRAAKKLGFYDQGLTTTRLEVLAVGDGSYRKRYRRFGIF